MKTHCLKNPATSVACVTGRGTTLDDCHLLWEWRGGKAFCIFQRVLILAISTDNASWCAFCPLLLPGIVAPGLNMYFWACGWFPLRDGMVAAIIIETSIIAPGTVRKPAALLGCWPTNQLVSVTTNFVIRYEKQLTLLIDDPGLDLFFLSSVTMYKCTNVQLYMHDAKQHFCYQATAAHASWGVLDEGGNPTMTSSTTLALQLMSALACCPKWYARTIFAVH